MGMEGPSGLQRNQVAAALRVGELNLLTRYEWPSARSDHARQASGPAHSRAD